MATKPAVPANPHPQRMLSDVTADSVLALIRDRVLELPEDFGVEDDLPAAGLDSMAIMQLLLAVEEEFGVSLPVESVSKKHLSSARALAQHLASNGAPGSEDAAHTAEVRPSLSGPPDAPSPPPSPPPPPTRSDAPTRFQQLRLRGPDYFVLCFDRLSRKTGQGGHKAHSFLLLDSLPDTARLRLALEQAAALHPMLNARLKKRWLPGIPSWVPSQQPTAPRLFLHSEKGSPGRLLAEGAEAFEDAHTLMEQITNLPMPVMKGVALPKARFHLLECKDGSAALIFSWNHLMMDGVGAELFLQELNAMEAGESRPLVPPFDPEAFAPPTAPSGALNRAWPIIEFFRKLARSRIPCLGPMKPRRGGTRFLAETLTAQQTEAVRARCSALCGDLVTMPFYLAAAMRAHAAVFDRRGQPPPSQVSVVPLQTRRKGTPGPIFLNHITVFFGILSREDAASMERATASLLGQHARFLKDRMGDSLNDLLGLMSYIPPSLYMAFTRMQMRGPFSTLFHSHTGEFAAGLNQFMGATVTGAFHVPGILTPPGTGIFCNEKNGRLVVTACWHEDALDEAEKDLMMQSFLADLGVS